VASPLSADMLTAVEEWSVEYIVSVLKGVAGLMEVDGYVYGDVKLNREQRIMAFLHMRDSGELGMLNTVNPKLAEKYAAEYERDIVKTPVFTGGI
jgi:hypothetical protein